MGKKIAIDFGTSNTTIALWNETLEKEELMKIDGMARKYKNPSEHAAPDMYCIPSIINFDGNNILAGQEVFDRGKEFSHATFRDIKRYIMKRKPLPRDVGGKKISFYDSGEYFLSEIISRANNILGDKIQEIIFTLPVDAFQHYQEWIGELCVKFNIDYYRVIDEPSACAFGYDAGVEDGDIIMVFDFGGGTLDVSVVKVELSGHSDRKSVVVGKGGAGIGGIDIDTWIMEDLLRQNELTTEKVQHIINHLRQTVEEIKIDLSFNKEASLSVFDDLNGTLISADYTREKFEEILTKNNLFNIIQEILDDSLEEAALRGIRRRDIKHVLMIGGSSLIPSVKKLLHEKFPGKIKSYRPFDAVVKGACRYGAGKILDDYIKHDYCLKHWIWSDDRYSGRYGYEPFIPRGTKYPVSDVAKFKIDAAVPGQKEVELMIFEARGHNSQKMKNEMIYNSDADKYEIISTNVSGDEDKVLVNEKNPTFIKLEPPARGGEKRISVSFSIDENRLLRITVVDLKINKILYKDQPVVKLN